MRARGRGCRRSGSASQRGLGRPGWRADSRALDEAIRLVTASGRPLLGAVAMLMPPVQERRRAAGPVRSYQANARTVEAWDGRRWRSSATAASSAPLDPQRPAPGALRDLRRAGDAGVRAGVLDVEDERVLFAAGSAGGLLAVDLEAGRLVDRDQLESELAARHARDFVRCERCCRRQRSGRAAARRARPEGARRHRENSVRARADTGRPPSRSARWATTRRWRCSERRGCSSYFKQRSPRSPTRIDPLRERVVMSRQSLGPRPELFVARNTAPAQIEIASPLLR